MLFKNSFYLYNRYLVIRWRKNNKDYFRFCILTSKKNEKSAVKRNFVRRQIKAILRQFLKIDDFKIDFAIIPKKFFFPLSFERKNSCFLQLFQKIKIRYSEIERNE